MAQGALGGELGQPRGRRGAEPRHRVVIGDRMLGGRGGHVGPERELAREQALDALLAHDQEHHVGDLDAADEALVRRFSETRRKHPLAARGGALGAIRIPDAPQVLTAFNPLNGLTFLVSNGWLGIVILGSVFLGVTGAEALYADMGHFGRQPIRIAWIAFVLPALLLNYYGQGALILSRPEAVNNPFFNLAPEWGLLPLVILSTAATIIASQAVITGAFSIVLEKIPASLATRITADLDPRIAIGEGRAMLERSVLLSDLLPEPDLTGAYVWQALSAALGTPGAAGARDATLDRIAPEDRLKAQAAAIDADACRSATGAPNIRTSSARRFDGYGRIAKFSAPAGACTTSPMPACAATAAGSRATSRTCCSSG